MAFGRDVIGKLMGDGCLPRAGFSTHYDQWPIVLRFICDYYIADERGQKRNEG